MQISKKTYLASLTITVLVTSLLTLAVFHPELLTSQQEKPPSIKANVYVCYETLAFGKQNGESHNIVTNIMERYVRNILGWDNVTANNATQWIALGNSTIAATNTKLDTEATASGFTRAANDTCVAWMNGTDYAYNVTKKFTATGTIRVNATSIHWNSTSNSDGNCAALASITATTFANGDNCSITWVWTIDGN